MRTKEEEAEIHAAHQLRADRNMMIMNMLTDSEVQHELEYCLTNDVSPYKNGAELTYTFVRDPHLIALCKAGYIEQQYKIADELADYNENRSKEEVLQLISNNELTHTEADLYMHYIVGYITRFINYPHVRAYIKQTYPDQFEEYTKHADNMHEFKHSFSY